MNMELWITAGNYLRMTKPKHYLKEWRTFRELSQEEAAERLDMDRGHLSKIERGVRPYNQPFLEAAAHVYKCTIADLLTRHPEDVLERRA